MQNVPVGQIDAAPLFGCLIRTWLKLWFKDKIWCRRPDWPKHQWYRHVIGIYMHFYALKLKSVRTWPRIAYEMHIKIANPSIFSSLNCYEICQ